MIWLSAEGEQELIEVLARTFTPEDLNHKIADPVGVPAAQRSAARDFRERVRTLVQWAKDSQKIAELLSAALRGNPSSVRLRQLNEFHGLLPPSSALLDQLGDAVPADMHDVWLRRMVEIQRQVCRIIVALDSHEESPQATGFLVGPDLVMTEAQFVLENKAALRQARFTFEGATFSSHPQAPLVVRDAGGACILRLDRQAARETSHTQANVAVRSRGWVEPCFETPTPGSPLLIVQFRHEATSVSLDPQGVLKVRGDELHYRTASHRGSTGAPCCDADWRCVGMHLGGSDKHLHNFGRSAKAIRCGLNSDGYEWTGARGVEPLPQPAAEPVGAAAGSDLDELIGGLARSLQASDDAWSPDVEDLGLPPEQRWSWAEAAAVHATFDPDHLRPHVAASLESRVALLLESRQIGDRWVMSDALRKRALQRLAQRGELVAARKKNVADPNDRIDVALGRLIEGAPTPPAELADPESLRALLTAADWLDRAVGHPPDRALLGAFLERATLLAPFRHLTRGFFAGREDELARLAEYVQSPSRMPLFIHAAGGMGKSALLAHFVLTNSTLNPADPHDWHPFVYLDFDRPEVDPTNLAGILLETVRQLGTQATDLSGAARELIARHVDRRRARRGGGPSPGRRKRSLAAQLDPDVFTTVLDDVVELLAALPPGPPILLILDTLEEVQFSSPDSMQPLMGLVEHLQIHAPQLRPVLAGRIQADGPVKPMELHGLRPAASQALLGNELPSTAARNTHLVERIAELCRGNPLSLRLAAELVRREAGRAWDAIQQLTQELQDRLADALVQGRLYERILGHIHQEKVKKIAHPGLVLRRITWELIRDVLAGPCKLGPIDAEQARELFDLLSEEVALVRRGNDPDELQLRPELRRIVREDLSVDKASQEQREAIHKAAIYFYAQRTTPRDRAEEIYHRLARGEDPDQIDARWMSGVEPFLRDAVGELPPAANAYLANRIGGVSAAADIASASLSEWEEYAAKRAGDLLRFGQPARALELLAERPGRLPGSRLHYIESIARRCLPMPDLQGAAWAAEQAVVAARARANSDEIRDALEELVLVRRLNDDEEGVFRALADLANLGDELGDDLVLLQSEVESLESIAMFDKTRDGGHGEERARFTQGAVRVFHRLSDEVVAKAPELARRVAAQIGGSDPSTLQRVIRIVGLGPLDGAAAEELRKVLDNWQQTDRRIAQFVPGRDKSPPELAAAVRYLVSTRPLPPHIASELASRLGKAVTPRH